MKHKKEICGNQNVKIFQNRAVPDSSQAAFQNVVNCECCLEEIVFAMQDNHHKFSIGLSTIMTCLAIAQKEGYVPEIPEEWWFKIRTF